MSKNFVKNKYFTYYDFSKKNKTKPFFFIICDHASNNLPKKYKNLGLKKKYLKSHIAWDPGAKDLTLDLSKKLNGCCFLSNFSRLYIDLNRPRSDKSSILSESFGVQIPFNQSLSKSEKKERVNYFDNYHQSLNSYIRSKQKKYLKIYLISIHTFTKKTVELNRPTEIGLLWNKNMNLLLPLQKKFREMKINVGNNKPYSGFFFNYTLDVHSKFMNIDNISVEIRNDLLSNKKKIDKWSKILKIGFKSI